MRRHARLGDAAHRRERLGAVVAAVTRASATRRVGAASMLLDYVAALGVHLTWGCQPVFTRYLQFAAGLETVPLLLASQGLSFACLLLSLVFGRACGPATREEKPPAWSPSKRAAFAVAYGCATAARASTNMASAAMTEAWHVTLVALLGPFVTALLSRAALGERVPRALWPCVVVASGGAALAASGEARAGRFRRRDALGCGLQLVSMVFSGSARVLICAETNHWFGWS